jgi:hypothetical protein
MQAYVDQLLLEIENAKREEAHLIKPDRPFSLEEHFEEVERWLESDPAFTFSYYCGLRKEEFPPPESLSEEQLQQITAAFESLLYNWNLSASIPEVIPLSKAYELLISVLDEKVDIVDEGIMTFEFCAYDPPSCPFGEYCECREFYDSYEPDMDEDLFNEDEQMAGEN